MDQHETMTTVESADEATTATSQELSPTEAVVEPAEAQPEPAAERPQPSSRPSPARPGPPHKPRTKLVCTIGPATAERVKELVEAGMDVARINFSHGTPEEHKRAVDAVRASAHSVRRSVAVMVDLQPLHIRPEPPRSPIKAT